MTKKLSVAEVLELLEDDDFGLSDSDSDEEDDGNVYCYSGKPVVTTENIAATEEVYFSDGSGTEKEDSDCASGNGSEEAVSSEEMDLILSSKLC